jgi:hypothetical protein
MLVFNLRNEEKRSAVARVGIIFLVAVIIAIAAAAYYIFYFPTTYRSPTNPPTINLGSFALNPQTSTLTGTVKFESNSQISTMGLYINGTYIGSENYTTIKSELTPLVGGNWKYAYSLSYSASSSTFPAMSNISLTQDKAYLIMLKATFDDGSQCNGTTTVLTS